ncbi:family 78 glycoside hydrolase catalytic domain [Ruficoccus amylovorans]|uniref:alpha-L-rhamnosidase n=1 Tax=Ruficoccus amylovorans TaxID=1804625 RepID=A0A842HC61_9BACT|nr:glycoside hydrolase family 78 protein [Ruficoccus amylovorans]MBC2594002.1 family 78 glycoside hydrolase catalytic domain [Ruficoccus amylovorans]
MKKNFACSSSVFAVCVFLLGFAWVIPYAQAERTSPDGVFTVGDASLWIGHPERGAAEMVSLPAVYLRKPFEVTGEVKKATLHITARGLFEAYLNGERTDEDWLVPGWTDFSQRQQVLSYEVTDLLREGQNVLGVILADGWYAGIGFFFREERIYQEEPALRLRLEIELADGSTQLVNSDESWQAATGPVLSADLFDGERYDARLEMPGWAAPGFEAGGWGSVAVRDDYPEAQIVYESKRMPPVRPTAQVAAKSVTRGPGGEWIFDLGQNMVGVAELKATGRSGQAVTLRFAEMLNSDGSLYTENLRKAAATDTYIFGQEGESRWAPRFTYHGFRYVAVEGLESDEPPALDTVTGIVLGNALRPTGHFRTSDERLNRLQENIVWSQRGNFLEVPTDCPQRDERLGWTGDAQVFARTATFNYDVSAFFNKWMADMRDARNPEGAFIDVVPGDPRVQTGSSPGWADAGVIVPWVMYERYGDKQILADNYRAMKEWVDWLEAQCAPRGLLWNETGYGDWLALDKENPKRASDTNTPRSLVGTAYFAHSADLLSQVADVLGHPTDAAHYRDLFERVRAAFQKAYISSDGRIRGDTQTVYLLALGFGLVPDSLRAKAVDHLVEDLEKRGWRLSTGFIGTALLMPVLDQVGRNDVAFKLLQQDAYPGWLYPVSLGATTMWERWNSWTPEAGFGPPHMNSFNHYAYGAVGEWMYAVLGGIRPLSPGFGRVMIAPTPGGGVTWVECSLESPHGLISSDWKIDDGYFSLKAILPPGVGGEVVLPNGEKHSVGEGAHRYRIAWPAAAEDLAR